MISSSQFFKKTFLDNQIEDQHVEKGQHSRYGPWKNIKSNIKESILFLRKKKKLKTVRQQKSIQNLIKSRGSPLKLPIIAQSSCSKSPRNLPQIKQYWKLIEPEKIVADIIRFKHFNFETNPNAKRYQSLDNNQSAISKTVEASSFFKKHSQRQNLFSGPRWHQKKLDETESFDRGSLRRLKKEKKFINIIGRKIQTIELY